MKINTQNVCVNQNNKISNKNYKSCPRYRNILTKDTFTTSSTSAPSFTSALLVPKSMFKGIDFAVIEKYKAPLETFHTIKDFEKWAEDEYYKTCMTDFGGRTGEVKYKRESMICDWDQALNSDLYSNSEKLLIIKGITTDLKPNTETICPVYNRKILHQTMDEIKADLEKDKKLPFSFNKRYRKNLIDMYTEHSSVGNNESKWIVIPSKDNNPLHFKENIEKLQSISTSELCTKFSGAEFHLRNGDIHVYMENGKPKVLLRLNDGVVQEINGEHNDYHIPKECVELTEKYLYENDLITTEKADEILRNSKLAPEIKSENTEQKNKKEHKGFFSFFKDLFG